MIVALVMSLGAAAVLDGRVVLPDEGGARLARLTRAVAALDARDLDGRRWTASDLRGRVVVLDFWATWCAPCLADIPWLRRVHDQDPDARVVVLGVNLDVGERRRLITWLNRQRVEWPQLHDGRGYNGGLARLFEVTSLPTSILVDRHGRVVATHLRGEALLAAVQAEVSTLPSPSSSNRPPG